MKILFFGNDGNTYRWVNEQITQPGQCSVVVGASGLEEARLMLKSICFDVILYCINDSNKKAKEIINDLKGISKTTPIVVLTSIVSLPEALEAVKTGAETYIIKETKMPGLVSQCLNMVVSKKFDYLKRFSASGTFPQANISANNSTPFMS